VSYVDAFAIVWALCPAGLTFAFTKEVPILGRGINALQVPAGRVRKQGRLPH
jgi:hypothetical protein